MEKESRLFNAISEALIGYKKDNIIVLRVISPSITDHTPTDKDESVMEEWTSVKLDISIRGREQTDDKAYIETNFKILSALFNLTYDYENNVFKANISYMPQFQKM